jgi:hypothetical protein
MKLRYNLVILVIIFILSGCSTLFNGIIGNFDHFDNNEYYQIVELQYNTSIAKQLCTDQSQFKDKIDLISMKLDIVQLYSSGKVGNDLIIKQIITIKSSIDKLKARLTLGSISSRFCSNKVENIETMFNLLRKSSGGKKK